MIVYSGEGGEAVEPDQVTRDVFEWAQAIGLKFSPKLKYPVIFPPGYLGVQALEQIEPCEDLLIAPNSSMLSTKLMNTPELLPVFSSHPEFFSLPDKGHEDYRMITFMAFEQSKGHQSKWKAYLDFLPKDVETIIDWNDSELSELQDEDFKYDSVFRRERDNKGNRELAETLKAYPELFSAEYLTLSNLNWIWKILCTRSYGRCVPFNSLIPLADLFNHSNVNTNYFYANLAEKCPDSESESLKVDLEDTDDPLVEKDKPIVFSSLKLHRLAFAAVNKVSPGEDVKEKSNEILQQARLEDSQNFVSKMNAAYKSAEYGSAAEDDESYFRISCSKFERYEPGAQVFISYGKYSDRQLLTNYGFALGNNPYNYARVKFELIEFLNQDQAGVLTGGFKADSQVLFKMKKHEICLEFLKVLRSFLWTCDLSAKAFLKPNDLGLEKRVLEKARFMLNGFYARFETSLEQDREILGTATGKKAFAVLYRIGVKEVVLQQVRFYELMQHVLNQEQRDWRETGKLEEMKGLEKYLIDLQEFN